MNAGEVAEPEAARTDEQRRKQRRQERERQRRLRQRLQRSVSIESQMTSSFSVTVQEPRYRFYSAWSIEAQLVIW